MKAIICSSNSSTGGLGRANLKETTGLTDSGKDRAFEPGAVEMRPENFTLWQNGGAQPSIDEDARKNGETGV